MNDNTVRNISTPVSQQCAVPSHVQRVGLFVDGAVRLLSCLYIRLKTVDTIVARYKVKVQIKVKVGQLKHMDTIDARYKVKVQIKVRVGQLKHMDNRMARAMAMDENNFLIFRRNKIKDHKL